jgi:hypothetical protein
MSRWSLLKWINFSEFKDNSIRGHESRGREPGRTSSYTHYWKWISQYLINVCHGVCVCVCARPHRCVSIAFCHTGTSLYLHSLVISRSPFRLRFLSTRTFSGCICAFSMSHTKVPFGTHWDVRSLSQQIWYDVWCVVCVSSWYSTFWEVELTVDWKSSSHVWKPKLSHIRTWTWRQFSYGKRSHTSKRARHDNWATRHLTNRVRFQSWTCANGKIWGLYQIRQEDRAGSSSFDVCLSLKDSDDDPVSSSCKFSPHWDQSRCCVS